MKLWTNTKWICSVFLFLVLSALLMTRDTGAQAGFVGTQTCIGCHQTEAWLDNNPPFFDVVSGNANVDYIPLNLQASHQSRPFYTVPDAYNTSIHNIPSFDVTITDEVKCEGCHGSGLAHFGVGPIPKPIPGINECGKCHNLSPSADFPLDLRAFLLTAHANRNNKPPKFFDQGLNGKAQAKTSLRTPGALAGLSLFKSNQRTIVTKNERIQECSVCHSYALNYPQFVQKIAANNMPSKPTVSCAACHDAHIPGPNGLQPAVVDGVVSVAALSSATVISVTPVQGRSDFYLNHKPYKLAANGAQDTINGTWTRGSAIARPKIVVASGVGTLNATSDSLTFPGGGFSGNVQRFFTLFILDSAFAEVPLPLDAVDAGQLVKVEATILAGFGVEEVINDTTLQLNAPVVATTTVTYKKAGGGTGSLPVSIPFIGAFRFEIKDMKTNPENLCGSCHTQGKFKFSVWGKKKDGSFIDVSNTHNNDVLTQYYSTGFFPPGPGQQPIKGHAARFDAPFLEFSAFEVGSHQPTYPFDMRISGSGGVGSLRNKGNTNFVLTTPNAQNDYLVAAGNTTQFTFQSAFACYQCHHGLGSIDYQNDVQGTEDARILWGDSTVTCWTCHDPHKSKIEANVRVPVKLSYNSLFVDAVKNPRGGIDKFMDGTDIPEGVGNGKICLFCHQGRESGLTIFLRIKAKGIDPYTDPNRVIGGVSLANPHYLDSGALLWSKNAWEFFFNGVPQQYSTGIPEHQEKNCMDCHMTPASTDANTGVTVGSHTWRPDIATCQASGCHPGATEIRRSLPRRAGDPSTFIGGFLASADYDGDGVVKTTFEEVGTINDPDFGDSGLLGQLRAALLAKGIFYDPDTYPYFFNAQGGGFNQFTSNTMAAAFNLAWVFKSGTCIPYHNAPYIVQILQDSLVALDVPLGARKRPPPPVTGSRPATDYRTIVVNP